MKTVIAINSSQRRKYTYGLIQQIADILADEDISVETVQLSDLNIGTCIGCEHCIKTDACVLRDDCAPLMEKLEAADGIILASPVYLQQVSGRLKVFIDRSCRWFHRPVLFGKPLLCVATTKGSGLQDTLAYLEKVAIQWGASPAGKIGRTIRTQDKPVSKKEVAAFARLVADPSGFRPGLSQLVNFEVQKAMAQNLMEIDARYWRDKGWNARHFYYKCRILPLRGLISAAVGSAMRHAMAKAVAEASAKTQSQSF